MPHTPEHIETEEELNKRRFEAAGLSPLQQQAVTAGAQLPAGFGASVPAVNGPITTDTLTPSPGIDVPPPPTPTTPTTTAGQAEIDSFNKLIGTTDTKDTDSLTSLMEKYLSTSQAPTPQVGLYEQALQASGVTGLEQGLLGKQGALRTAQSKLAAITAQLGGLKAEETAIPIRLQEEARGRGITAGGLAPLQAGELRKVALRAIPLQAQALGAQAEIFSAQGDVELAQGALKIASDRLNTLFDIKSTDATNLYNYWKDLRDKVFDFATEREKNKLAVNQKADDRKFELEKDNINNAQALSIKFMENGQADLASRATQLDLKSATFKEDLAALQAQFKPKVEEPKVIGSAETGYLQFNPQTGKYDIRVTQPQPKSIGGTLTLTEAKSLNLPVALVGQSESEVLSQLQSSTTPNWFRPLIENKLQVNLTSQALQTEWNKFRNKIIQGFEEKKDKTKLDSLLDQL